MEYNRTVWVNEVTPLDADHFNNIENGIVYTVAAVEDLESNTYTKDEVYTKSEVYAKSEVYSKAEITISTSAAPTTGTPNTFYIQII